MRHHLIRDLAVAALLFVVAFAAVFVFRSGGYDRPLPTAPHTLRVNATFLDQSLFFGDRVDAELQMIVPSGTANSQLQFHPDFWPYRIAYKQMRSEDLGAGLKRVTVSYQLLCLKRRCLPGARGVAVVSFPATLVSIPGHKVEASWPSLTLVSRLLIAKVPTGDQSQSLPLISPAIHARRASYIALAVLFGSLVVFALAAVLLFGPHRGEGDEREVEQHSLRDGLAEALHHAERHIVEDIHNAQRHAFGALAAELRKRGRHQDASEAERIAWAPEKASSDEMKELLARAKRRQR